jgi:hypothetical protein
MLVRFLVFLAVLPLAVPAYAQPATGAEPLPTLPPMVVPATPIIVPDRTATTEEARQERSSERCPAGPR